MRFIHKNENGYGGVKVVAELNQYKEAEKRDGRGGVAGEGQGLSEEDELRIIDDGEDANSRRSVSSVQLPVVTHRSQSQVQGRVRWDKFLPVGNPKVLLVESDDSTRHVVTALLRNCSYEVTAVSSGVEAWKILEDLNNQIDLVLTEVVTSGLSGIGLLSKIMSHTSCHNTPVIMMSSLDSMGLVVRCLSKGAADFLMKPIRKNELKNLWQHIWRRCHYSSGSGGESFIRNEKSIGAKCAKESNDDTGSDDEDDNRSIGLQARNGSDNGSGTQSSWTKRAAEVDSPQRPSAWDQGTDPPDSTCAQVIYPMPEAYASSWMPGAMQEHDGQDNQLDNVPMGKDLEVGVPRNTDSSLNGPNRKLTLSTAAEKFQTSQLDLNLKNDGQNFDEENLEINNEKPKGERNTQAMNLPEEAISNEEHLRGNLISDAPPVLSEISKNKDKVMNYDDDLPSLDLSLKRVGDVADASTSVLDQNILRHSGNLVSDAPPVLSEISKNKDKVMNYDEDLPSLELSLKRVGDVADASTNVLDQNILRHSQLSAFTRYNTGSNGNQGQTGNVGSCSTPNNSSEAAKQYKSDPPNQISNSSSNNNNMGSTTDRSFTKPVMANDKTPAKSTVHGSQQSSVFQPVQSGKTTGGPLNTALLQENETGDQQLKNQHHHDYHHHNFHSVQQLHKVPPQDDTSKSTLQCGSSSNASRVPTEANVNNGSLNGSASGSNHGSNGSSAVVNAEGSNKVNDSGITAKDGVDNGSSSGSGSGSGSGVGVDQNRSAQREAALNKFRLKRKERCFDKKVRYQSRKKLADQRPRVRGQFVRQERETKGKYAES